MKYNQTILAGLFCLLSFNTIAKVNDLEQEVKIAAASQEADIKNNQVIFFGPVEVTQGSIKMNADELRVFSKADKSGKTLVATGKPATYTQTMDDGRPATASAKEIRYELATRTLTLVGDATLEQDGSQVTGNRIRYNISKQQLIAESTGQGDDRVITIIQPETYQEDKPETPSKQEQ
ncbi:MULTISPECIES: lipopolysaccharide transport periplasmic protein LptA [Shewanella]|uniref:Lipopolysaccharide export system protein LptA n=1 Tax=Shewanella fidelis TaxID=173509 RepID=A0AAW8NIW7_9GAMM|nr:MULTISPECIES: lipopolysaccharide transport periplasmic protein LptA [Shewanella]MDR8522305.1 lipopolysaccharide transport periplasmic protein LptA [Shewanella fidelis]MDW4812479.1 lipopolysaccharide transport periplasmic protein LptA [Shewanella fidelis]MDW4816226.1 lipopolysaccharide transport periplasmic protein LptA [Shewanella fidelis]MDW4820720.1 lipopolysaccharide transport periplasmic protein LptA [Shewanella fidelis]MDW4824942.1 lipopolysaccharide transport periplasmic protein LptA 